MRILLIRLSALGDVVTASPVPRVIKEAQPDAEVVWAVEERCAEAVRGHPFVDELVVLPTSRQWGRWLRRGRLNALREALGDLRRQLRARRFDAVIDLQGLFKSALIAGVAAADVKIAPDDAAERLPGCFTQSAPRQTEPDHIASMYTGLLAPLGIAPRSRESLRLVFAVGDPAREQMAAWLAERGLAPGGYVAIVPGTTRPQKMWPAAYWPDLMARLHREHGLPAVLIGGPSEQALAAELTGATGSPLQSAVGATDIKQTGALLEAAALTVAVDTGPMHLAVAVGCPTISVFGSTGPRLFNDGSPYRCLHRQFACWPCHRHPVCEHYECLAAIRPADVARAARRLLGATVR